jgi:hypothetical protein
LLIGFFLERKRKVRRIEEEKIGEEKIGVEIMSKDGIHLLKEVEVGREEIRAEVEVGREEILENEKDY